MITRRVSAVHRALGDAFLRLPAPVQNAHDNGGTFRLSGHADVEVKPGWLPRLICWAVGLPRHGAHQPVSVDFFTDENGVDRWVRNFAGRMYKSTLRPGTGAHEGKLIENLGIFTTIFGVAADTGRLTFDIERVTALGLPLPGILSVRCHAFETGDGGAFVFDIAIDMGLTGRLIRYRGTMS